MKPNQKKFCIDLVNLAVQDGILEESFIIKKNSHNKYAGMVTLRVEDDEDKTLHKIDPSKIWGSVRKICDEDIESLEEEVEKNVLLANKRLDPSVLESYDFLTIFHLAVFEELS